MRQVVLVLIMSCCFSCGSSDESSDDASTSSGSSTNITNVTLTNSSASCSDYAGSYTSTATDINNGTSFNGSFTITSASSSCSLTSNSIPNHDFNDGSTAFATNVAEVSRQYSIPLNPSTASSTTALSMSQANVILLNGAPVDVLPAACYGVGSEPLGQEKIGCTSLSYAWRYDPVYSGNNFGTDSHNAHSQPQGLYHYHADPKALYSSSEPLVKSPVIGFAADGFPLYGPYIDDNGTVRKVTSSYKLRSGTRSLSDLNDSTLEEGASPGGSYDGTFRDDYEYVAGEGDLDECNGMTVDGQYGYYVTDSYPYLVNCFKGTPDSSFGGS